MSDPSQTENRETYSHKYGRSYYPLTIDTQEIIKNQGIDILLHDCYLLLLLVLPLITLLSLMFFTNYYVYAHITGNRTQQWIDTHNSVKIQFAYDPVEPFVGAPAELRFSIQNLQTGQHLKDLYTRVAILDRQSVLKLSNMTVPDGDFSMRFVFPAEGTYQVVLSVSSQSHVIALASFRVFVPFQPFGTFNLHSLNPFIFPALVLGLIGAALVTAFVIIIMKKGYKKSNFKNSL
jgi:hypothetical protein